ncbi:hypothetical protein AALP_AA8G333500 [Arabis alpina]|uniref:BZIP domain-containing protein n=1 Tax=Arabis alpina TaxID=50452 RepID=A0A087GB43_ARAAL|nr:hypothetical protein AALP_AA8G333500 [Arabis alpina]
MVEDFSCFDSVVDDDFLVDFDPSLFTDLDPSFFDDLDPPAKVFTRESASPVLEDIESLLMNDEHQDLPELDQQSVSDFLADLFVDYHPTSDSATDKVLDLPIVDSPAVGSDSDGSVTGKLPIVDSPTAGSDSDGFVTGKEAQGSSEYIEKKSSETPNDSGSESQDGAEVEGNDDPVAKKRRRQLRNRDAAVRSRERKKEYVKDLETKSKYLERECLRLGRILDCFAAENQSLRLCLQKGGNHNASMTRQESAVLLLESLLLGSLLWYLGSIICQFPQPHTKSQSQSLELETEEPERLVLSGRESNILLESITWKSRRCKGSRPRMKQQGMTLVA